MPAPEPVPEASPPSRRAPAGPRSSALDTPEEDPTDLADLAATVHRLTDQADNHNDLLNRLMDAPDTAGLAPAGAPGPPFILSLDGDAYEAELAALETWVTTLLLPTYGREVTTATPWCARWTEHPEAVARLHALHLAYRDLTAPEAGPTGPSVWHRDHLDPALLQLRAPNGPFAACTTNPDRPAHRLLPTP